MLNSDSSLPVSKLRSFLAELKKERSKRRRAATDAFARYRDDPAAFVEKALGGFIWSKQREVCESVRDNRYTAVKSCHDVGKTAIAGRIAAWWLSVHPPGEAFVVTSAPTWDQVRALLWREINSVHHAGGLPGRTNQTEWIFEPNELVGFGRAVRDTDPTAFQGIHARRVLVIFDEACAMSKAIWEAAETLVANEDSRFLAIGNPDDPASEFARCCKPGGGYNVIQISAFDSPNFTNEAVPEWLLPLLVSKTWVEERRRKWGEDSPLWISKVLGDFPEQSADGLIPISAVREAGQRELPLGEASELGVDVARFGTDKSVIYHRRGPVARKHTELTKRDLMSVCGAVVTAIRETGATHVKIDDLGLGGGVTDRLIELRSEGVFDAEIVPINVSEKCRDFSAAERFLNLRAELNWMMRERFLDGDIDIEEDDDLLGQTVEIKYKQNSRGQVQIESKADMKKRGLPSPDDWDALVLCFAPKEYGTERVMEGQHYDFTFDPTKLKVLTDWPRVYGLDVDGSTVSGVWGAWDPHGDVVYLYGEYVEDKARPEVWASAIRKRGRHVPGVFDLTARRRSEEQGERIMETLADADLDIFPAEVDVEAAAAEINGRIAARQLKVAANLGSWLAQYRAYRRGRKGEIVEENDGLMQATGLLLLAGLSVATVDERVAAEARDEWTEQTRNPVTGY
jgi:hypothetical protein